MEAGKHTPLHSSPRIFTCYSSSNSSRSMAPKRRVILMLNSDRLTKLPQTTSLMRCQSIRCKHVVLSISHGQDLFRRGILLKGSVSAHCARGCNEPLWTWLIAGLGGARLQGHFALRGRQAPVVARVIYCMLGPSSENLPIPVLNPPPPDQLQSTFSAVQGSGSLHKDDCRVPLPSPATPDPITASRR